MNKTFFQERIYPFLISVAAFIILNFAVSFVYFRLDLTTEKRYTLAQNTKGLLKSLETPLHLKLYLTGELNPGFRYLSKATIEMLDEMEVLSGSNLRYEVVDPLHGSDSERSELVKGFKRLGIDAIPVFETLDDGSKKQSLVYPYLVVVKDKNEIVLNLLENIPGQSGSDNLNKSSEALEFKIVDGIRRLSTLAKPKIAFLEGHGELDELEVIDLTRELSKYYNVERGAIGLDAAILNGYKCVVVASPTKSFSEKDKFVLNQYVMQGGNLLWFLDGVSLSLDSLQRAPNSIGMPLELNLEDLLFKYGFRLNGVAIEDIQCSMIPVNVAKINEAPKFVPAPWYFNPLLLPAQNNAITRNINVVRGEFVSSLDTVGDDLAIKRTVLLASSRFSKVSKAPVIASLTSINDKPKKEEFNRSFISIGVLAEGKFGSSFEFRQPPVGIVNIAPSVTTGKFAKIVVVADGDIPKNKVRFKDSKPQIIPLGYDEVSHQTFGNKAFVVNTINYLCDDMGWMELRNRSNTLRMLDKAKIGEYSFFYKMLNVVVPLILLILSGVVFFFLRKR